MANTISTTPTQPVAPPAETSNQKPSQSKPQSAAGDSVHVSPAAQAAANALQEVRETPTQTSQEARHGDIQARRLVAQEAASKPPTG